MAECCMRPDVALEPQLARAVSNFNVRLCRCAKPMDKCQAMLSYCTALGDCLQELQ